MIYFYLTMTVAASAFLLLELILRYMENIKNFGIDKKLFRFTGTTIPAEKLLPLTPVMLPVFGLGLGVAGLVLMFVFPEMEWYFTLPLSLLAGSLVCFTVQHPVQNALDKKAGRALPVRMQPAGIEGFAASIINPEGDGYGLVEFEYNDTRFRVRAVSANETFIPKQERVIVLYEEDGVYFVQSIREVYDVIDEEPLA
jgi:membrane protein implicated in regulation of membrane protease activity